MRERILVPIAVLSMLLALAGRSRASISAFSLEPRAWNATEIVVVEQHDSEVTVLETWRGSLEKGAVIRQLDLPKMPAEVRPLWPKPNDPPAGSVSGRRVVLFLKPRPERARGQITGDWVGADDWWVSAQAAAVWLEDGRAFAMQHVWSDEPLRMAPLDLEPGQIASEEQFKQEVDKLLAAKDAFVAATKLADPAERAAALRPLADGPSRWQCGHALSELAQCGPAGVLKLKELLAQHRADRPEVITYLIRAADEDAGRIMTEVLQDELPFWKAEGPKLPANWLSHDQMTNPTRLEAEARNRYRVLQIALERIEWTGYSDGRPIVTELRDLWKTIPPTYANASPGDSEMVLTCDEVLAVIDPQDDDRPTFNFVNRFPRGRLQVNPQLIEEVNALPTKAAQIEFLSGLLPASDDPKKALTDRQLDAIALLGQTRSPDVVQTLIDRLEFSAPKYTNPAIYALGQVGEPAVEPLVESLQTDSDRQNELAARTLKEIKGKQWRQFAREIIARPDLKLSQKTADWLARYPTVEWTD